MNPEAPNLLALSVGINTVLWAENCFSLHSFWKAVATHTSYTVRSWRLRSQSPKSPCNIIWAGIMIHSNSLRLHSRESAPGSQSALPTFYVCRETKSCIQTDSLYSSKYIPELIQLMHWMIQKRGLTKTSCDEILLLLLPCIFTSRVNRVFKALILAFPHFLLSAFAISIDPL